MSLNQLKIPEDLQHLKEDAGDTVVPADPLSFVSQVTQYADKILNKGADSTAEDFIQAMGGTVAASAPDPELQPSPDLPEPVKSGMAPVDTGQPELEEDPLKIAEPTEPTHQPQVTPTEEPAPLDVQGPPDIMPPLPAEQLRGYGGR